MEESVSRRSFVKGFGIAITATAIASWGGRGSLSSERATTGFRKAVKLGMVHGKQKLLEKFRLLKEIGFDGVEVDSPGNFKREDILRARDKTGLQIPGVVDSAHWKSPLSHPDATVRERGLEALRIALKDCKAYGATTVLLVPAVVNKQVAYDVAYRRSQAEIRKVLPLAEKLGVKIAIENVWNNFLLSPLELAKYVDEFQSAWVGVHFDVGNAVNYGWPEQWVRILGKRILKLDIKEYSRRKRDREGLWKGFQVKLLEGDCDWPEVMKALREIGYKGWGTAEVRGGDEVRLRDIATRMDRIFAS